MTKEHVDRPLRHGALDDRQRLLRRLARPAPGRQRLSRRLPGHHAAVLVHRRLVVRDAVRGVLLRAPVPREPDALGSRASPTTRSRRRAFFDHPNPANPVTFTTVIPNSGEPTRSCPGVPEDQVYDENTNPDGVRCTLQDYMVNAFGRDAQRLRAPRASTTSASSTGCKGLRQGLISPAQFVDFNTHIGGGGPRPQHHRGAHRGRPGRAAAALPHRRDQLGEQPRQGRDHRPPRPRPRRLPRRLPHVRDARAAPAQLRHRRQPGALARAGAADRGPVVRRRTPCSRSTAGWPASTRTTARSRWPRRSSRTSPTRSRRAAPTATGNEQPSEVCDQTVAAYGTPRLGADEPMTDDVMKCQLKPMRRDDYPVELHRRAVAASPGGVPRRRVRLQQAGREPAPGRCRGSPTRTRSGGVIYGGKPLGDPPKSRRIKK